jgi:hypothetical protein
MDGQLRRASETEAERKEGGPRRPPLFRSFSCGVCQHRTPPGKTSAELSVTVAGRVERARVYSHSSPGHLFPGRAARGLSQKGDLPSSGERPASLVQGRRRAQMALTEGLDVCRGALAPLSVFAPRGSAESAPDASLEA